MTYRYEKVSVKGLLAATGLLAMLLAIQVKAAEKDSSSGDVAKGGESSLKLEGVKPKDVPAPVTGEIDSDEVITNRKLRAETGSKNKFSFSASLNYNGGSLEKPVSNERPNIRGALGVPVSVSLSGNVGVKAKLTSLQSLSLDVGVGIARPFENDDALKKRSYANDPSLTYQVMYRILGIQNVTQVTANFWTEQTRQKLGYQWGPSLAQTAIYDFNGSKFSVGAVAQVESNFFSKDDAALKTKQGDYGAGLYPFMEYVINDRFNIRTISGLWVYDHSRSTGDFWRWNKNTIYQSVGLGISVTRDIFLYPNVQFLPENMRSSATNVALSTNMNF